MDDLNAFIAGYINYSRKDFIAQDAMDLTEQFMDETETDLDYGVILDEIKWAQEHC